MSFLYHRLLKIILFITIVIIIPVLNKNQPKQIKQLQKTSQNNNFYVFTIPSNCKVNYFYSPQFTFLNCSKTICLQYQSHIQSNSTQKNCILQQTRQFSEADCIKQCCSSNSNSNLKLYSQTKFSIQSLNSCTQISSINKIGQHMIIWIAISMIGFFLCIICLPCIFRKRFRQRIKQIWNNCILKISGQDNNQSNIQNQDVENRNQINVNYVNNHLRIQQNQQITINPNQTNLNVISRQRDINPPHLNSFVNDRMTREPQLQLQINKEGKRVKINQLRQDVDICVICLSTAIDCITPCGHFFHFQCIKKWIQKNPICPVCKNGNLKNRQLIIKIKK